MRLRYQPIFHFLVLLCLWLGGCTKDKDLVSPKALFDRDWYNTFESDASGTDTYRPEDEGPLRRGIDGFRLEEGGRFTQYTNAPTDEMLSIYGRWALEDNNRYRIEFANGQYDNYTLVVVSVEESAVKAYRL